MASSGDTQTEQVENEIKKEWDAFAMLLKHLKKGERSLRRCKVCKQIISGDATVVTKCMHKFCTRCVQRWVFEDGYKFCPKCLTELGSNPGQYLRTEEYLSQLIVDIVRYRHQQLRMEGPASALKGTGPPPAKPERAIESGRGECSCEGKDGVGSSGDGEAQLSH